MQEEEHLGGRAVVKVFVAGREGCGWSLDQDAFHVARFVSKLGHRIVESPFRAEVVHSVTWRNFLGLRGLPLRLGKQTVATASNWIVASNEDFEKARRVVTLWVAPSRGQERILKEAGVNVQYQPFYVDEQVFRPMGMDRLELASRLGIEQEVLGNRFLFGSFQRDTIFKDLESPKWQKNPTLLLDILAALPNKDNWLLVLAGPRRHYVLRECRQRGIPFVFCGKEPTAGIDDIASNTLNSDMMSMLYNLIDCYIVTSASEGGPKAVLEGVGCGIAVMSTPVGLAPDLLAPDFLYEDCRRGVEVATTLMKDSGGAKRAAQLSREIFLRQHSAEATARRWEAIYRIV